MIVSIYIARTLRVANYSILSFVQAVISYCLIFSNFGLRIIGIRDIARDKSLTQKYAGSITAIRLIISVIIFLLLIIITELHK